MNTTLISPSGNLTGFATTLPAQASSMHRLWFDSFISKAYSLNPCANAGSANEPGTGQWKIFPANYFTQMRQVLWRLKTRTWQQDLVFFGARQLPMKREWLFVLDFWWRTMALVLHSAEINAMIPPNAQLVVSSSAKALRQGIFSGKASRG